MCEGLVRTQQEKGMRTETTPTNCDTKPNEERIPRRHKAI